MIDQLEIWLEQLNLIMGKISGSHYAIAFLSCLVAGYALKCWKKFPNDAIPTVVILWGGACFGLIADPGADTLGIWTWRFKNFFLGNILGLGAWLLHYKVLSYFEHKIPLLGKLLANAKPKPPPEM